MTPPPTPEPGRAPAVDPDRVVAVVLNWNGGEETAECLRSLRALEGAVPQIVLADNGSTDGSVEALLEEDPELTVLRFGENLGYAGGNNRAMRHAFGELGAEWVCLVNCSME